MPSGLYIMQMCDQTYNNASLLQGQYLERLNKLRVKTWKPFWASSTNFVEMCLNKVLKWCVSCCAWHLWHDLLLTKQAGHLPSARYAGGCLTAVWLPPDTLEQQNSPLLFKSLYHTLDEIISDGVDTEAGWKAPKVKAPIAMVVQWSSHCQLSC